MINRENASILLITGPVGVGKSSVADEVFEVMRKASRPVALISFDELTYASPRPKDDPYGTKFGLKNLSAIWPNYTEAGVDNFIIPYVVETRKDIDRFSGSIPGADVWVVRLAATTGVLRERLRNRLMGGSLEWHLNRAAELNDLYAASGIGDLVIDTDNKTIRAVAEEVIRSWGKTS